MKYNLYVKYVVNLMLNVDVIKRKCVMALNYILMVNVFYHFLLGKRGGELGNSAISLYTCCWDRMCWARPLSGPLAPQSVPVPAT